MDWLANEALVAAKEALDQLEVSAELHDNANCAYKAKSADTAWIAVDELTANLVQDEEIEELAKEALIAKLLATAGAQEALIDCEAKDELIDQMDALAQLELTALVALLPLAHEALTA